MYFNFRLNGYVQAFRKDEFMKMKFILTHCSAIITNLKFC